MNFDIERGAVRVEEGVSGVVWSDRRPPVVDRRVEDRFLSRWDGEIACWCFHVSSVKKVHF